MNRQIELSVQFGDILQVPADVIALKYAQGFYGADHAIANRLAAGNIVSLEDLKVPIGEHKIAICNGVVRARNALFVGTASIDRFRYEDIRRWVQAVMEILKAKNESIKHISLTLHGRGFGLEIGAAFLALLAGLVSSIRNKGIPDSLVGISIIENDAETYLQLRELIEQRFVGESFINPSPTGAAYSVSL